MLGRSPIWVLGLTAGAIGACTASDQRTEAVAQTRSAVVDDNLAGSLMNVTFERGRGISDLVLSATDTLRFNDRARISTSTVAIPLLSNLGPVETNIGVDSLATEVFSDAPVAVRDRAQLTGALRSCSNISLGVDVILASAPCPNIEHPTMAAQRWLPLFDSTAAPFVLEPDQTGTILPGNYGAVSVKSRAVLDLRAGEYRMASLNVEPDAQLNLPDGSGALVLSVKDSLLFRGTFTGSGATASSILISYAGSAPVAVETPFRGTLVAPRASISVASLNGALHQGAFLGRAVEVHQDARVQHVPFGGWQSIARDTFAEVGPAADVYLPRFNISAAGSVDRVVATATPVTPLQVPTRPNPNVQVVSTLPNALELGAFVDLVGSNGAPVQCALAELDAPLSCLTSLTIGGSTTINTITIVQSAGTVHDLFGTNAQVNIDALILAVLDRITLPDGQQELCAGFGDVCTGFASRCCSASDVCDRSSGLISQHVCKRREGSACSQDSDCESPHGGPQLKCIGGTCQQCGQEDGVCTSDATCCDPNHDCRFVVGREPDQTCGPPCGDYAEDCCSFAPSWGMSRRLLIFEAADSSA